ncbi:hypothetical protein KOW79_002857 [Hemibagrus wyckioides]|uniref:Uncharacterized protein n=1 Tax=Hemibagrus wyckioides TaxID=337641 RepID=A0A9D3P4A8_9TELE|nr:hypothetical protein KOW79_002857 [Hemibagrus wyckioides]
MDLEKDSGSKDKWNRQRKKRGDAGRRGGARKEECRERMRLRGGAWQSPHSLTQLCISHRVRPSDKQPRFLVPPPRAKPPTDTICIGREEQPKSVPHAGTKITNSAATNQAGEDRKANKVSSSLRVMEWKANSAA